MNYIQALQAFLQKDPEIGKMVGERVGFLRMPINTEKPYIIFNEQEWSPALLNQDDYESGLDCFPVLIDVVVDYQQANLGRQLRQKIREKIWNFNGVLSLQQGEESKTGEHQWEGQISFLRFLACDYAVATDWVMRGGLYLFKQGRKCS